MAARGGGILRRADRRLKRGAFLGIVDLQAAINRYVADHRLKAIPLEGPDKIIAGAGHQTLDSIH